MTYFGSNVGYVDELYLRYLADPESVGEAWRDFFADWRAGAVPPSTLPGRTPAEEAVPPRVAAAPSRPAGQVPDGAEALRGAAARIVENMTESLGVPTATSVRTIPVKLLEENRRLANQHQAVVAGPRVSFTHLIAWGIVRALDKHPAMNAGYLEIGGVPHRVPRPDVHLGIAVDIERRGERGLVVPNLRDASRLDFPAFLAAYDDRVTRARQGRLAVDDFQGTTVSVTNPGMLGTELSVPRLMAGQGAIIGIGAIGYPAEYAGTAPETLSGLGVSKTMTVTSTYDHRVIQGAESGAFLATLERLLLGAEGFYERVFAELGVPHEPVAWGEDRNVEARGGGTEAIVQQARVLQLIRAYRVRGHLWADLDPLGGSPVAQPELELSHYGLTLWDLDRAFVAGGLAGHQGTMPLRTILDTLRETYCRHIGVEYMHIQEHEIRAWLQERMESTRNSAPIPADLQHRILDRLNAAEAFERFLHTSYVGHKRFSLEGAETLIAMLDVLLSDAGSAGVEAAFIGMSHRGRLNVLANLLGVSYGHIFRGFEGEIDPGSTYGSGDVKYHQGARGIHRAPDGSAIAVLVASNPSHLEAVDPVVEGMVRARQDAAGDLGRSRFLPILLHGDAAFSGQGVVAETLNLSQLKGYRTGGTIHVVINNQIGFTTSPQELRSSQYATDVARGVQAPIFHVNGDHPEDAVRVIRLALAFRQQFHRDVVVDLVCYRRWGHNEGDDPSYTHPLLYARIEAHRSVRKLYTEQLMRRGDLGIKEAEQALEDFRRILHGAHDEVREALKTPAPVPIGADAEATRGTAAPAAASAASRAVLNAVLDGLDRLPEGFAVHPKLAGQLARRRQRFESGSTDWSLAEALAFGSLALEGTRVRLSGEDSGRGTFSQRHATLFDFRTGEPFVPLAHLRPDQAPFNVHDSLLSEFAVLGFEYGYSVEAKDALVLWEAQFGDFVNGAQVIIDQFLAGAEEKWAQTSGLVLLLPHGLEGQGPEHSSARVERFLQLCAQGNMQVACPSTPAQYFHLLRRQARLVRPKPLVVLTPKSFLRHPEAVSTVDDLASGRFFEVIDDRDGPAPGAAARLILSSGKLHYELVAARRETGAPVALARLEQFYPFPAEGVQELLARYGGVADVVWAQEEPRNMGAWTLVAERAVECLAAGQALRYVGRPRASNPATGSLKRHIAEQQALVREAILGDRPAAASAAAATLGARGT
jgi:2-oxoglutarate dehydrogenase E1 component